VSNYTKVILKAGKEKSIQRFHPWIFSGAVEAVTKELSTGEIVEVYDNKRNYLATGHYQDEGSIAVKIFSFKQCEINYGFWKEKIDKAIQLRKLLHLLDNKKNNVYRLVHGEGDGLPGLIIDMYNANAVLQFHSVGMFKLKNDIVNILIDLLGDNLKSVYNKSGNTLFDKTSDLNEFLYNKSENEILVKENDNQYYVDIIEGQKTGFFIDQRDNRLLLENYCKDKKVLNVFGYTGGFSIAALKGGARLVHSVDSSQKAIDLCNRNVELNFGKTDKHLSFTCDAFDFLDKMHDDYDVIVLDPPAFAKQLHLKEKALKAYRNINQKVISKLKSGGVLFSFSCSQAILKDDFRTMMFSASALAAKNVCILHQLSQAADHPINIYHPESEYLKGFVVVNI